VRRFAEDDLPVPARIFGLGNAVVSIFGAFAQLESPEANEGNPPIAARRGNRSKHAGLLPESRSSFLPTPARIL